MKTFSAYRAAILLKTSQYLPIFRKPPSDKSTVNPVLYINTMAAKSNARIVDLRSDTITKPTPEMRQAMFSAPVGDDVFGEDPTVNKLEEKAAAMLGKESGLFISSGTMGNLLATFNGKSANKGPLSKLELKNNVEGVKVMVHCNERGSEIICGEKSHTFLFEQGGPAQIAGVQIWPLRNNSDGTFDLDEMEEKIRDHSDDHKPKTSLICAENTQNWCGGRVLPLKWLDELGIRAKKINIPLHMDGARLFNAAVYLKVPASRIVRDFASVTFCVSKGLGAPIGSVLVGDKEFIRKSRRFRKALGGGTRQAGVIAAAGIIALDSMIDRLEEDHTRAKAIAKGITDSGSNVLQVDYQNLHTNIIMININHSQFTSVQLCNRLEMVTKDEAAELGERIIVKAIPVTKKTVRFVTFYEITDDDTQAVIRKLKFIIKELGRV